MDTTENNELNYLENNWSFDPDIDLDYENKFFEIVFDSGNDPERVNDLWRGPLKEFINEGKGVVLGVFPNPFIVGFFIDDPSKDLLSVVGELKRLNVPDDVSVKRYQNYKEFQQFDSFSKFENAISNL